MSGKPAARLTDTNNCPKTGHGTNPVTTGSGNVFFNGLPVARVGDATSCGDTIASGIGNILINGMPVAFVGSSTAHGGVIVSGSGNIVVGTSASVAPFTPPEPLAGQFDEHFVLQDIDTGVPVANRPYRMQTASGQITDGVTDEQGRTSLICAYQAETVDVEFEPQIEVVIG